MSIKLVATEGHFCMTLTLKTFIWLDHLVVSFIQRVFISIHTSDKLQKTLTIKRSIRNHKIRFQSVEKHASRVSHLFEVTKISHFYGGGGGGKGGKGGGGGGGGG